MTSTGYRPPTTEAPSSDRPRTASKRSLVALSHAIEDAVLVGPVAEPTVVVALFQRLAYFEREYAVYRRLREAGVVVVIGFTDGAAHDVPPGCHAVLLDPEDPLADEWTVIAVGPAAGAYLVATDAHRLDPTESNLEAGREFAGRWGHSRTQAANELARIRIGLGPRLDAGTAGTIDRLLAAVMPVGAHTVRSSGTDGEVWATTALHLMVWRMQDARAGSRILREQLVDAHSAVAARVHASIEPQSGLPTPEFLSRWSGGGRPTPLPVGIAVFDVLDLQDSAHRREARATYHAVRRVAAALTEPLGPVDAALRLSEREFAIVVPGASPRHLREVVSAVAEQLELASEGYPHVRLSAVVATTVTLARPLPMDDLHLALGRPDRTAWTLSGDPIRLATTTALTDPDDAGWFDEPTGRPGTDTEQLPRLSVDTRPSTDAAPSPHPREPEPREPAGGPGDALDPGDGGGPGAGTPDTEDGGGPDGHAPWSTSDLPRRRSLRGSWIVPTTSGRGGNGGTGGNGTRAQG